MILWILAMAINIFSVVYNTTIVIIAIAGLDFVKVLINGMLALISISMIFALIAVRKF